MRLSATHVDHYESDLKSAEASFAGHTLRLNDTKNGHWIVQALKPDGTWSNTNRAEILFLTDGLLLVAGSLPIVAFSRYNNQDNPVGAVRWMAQAGAGYLTEKAQAGLCVDQDMDITQEFDREALEQDIAWYIGQTLIDAADIDHRELLQFIELEDGVLSSVSEEFEQYCNDAERKEADFDRVAIENEFTVLEETAEMARYGEATYLKAWLRAHGNLDDPFESWEDTRSTLCEDLEAAGETDVWECVHNLGEVVAFRLIRAQAALRKLLQLLEGKDTKLVTDEKLESLKARANEECLWCLTVDNDDDNIFIQFPHYGVWIRRSDGAVFHRPYAKMMLDAEYQPVDQENWVDNVMKVIQSVNDLHPITR